MELRAQYFRTDSEQVELLAAANAALKSVGMKGRGRLRKANEPERILEPTTQN